MPCLRVCEESSRELVQLAVSAPPRSMNMTQPKLWQCRRPRALPTLHRSQVRAGTCWDVKIGAPASTQEHLVRWSFRTDHGDDIGFEAFYIANAAVTASACALQLLSMCSTVACVW